MNVIGIENMYVLIYINNIGCGKICYIIIIFLKNK